MESSQVYKAKTMKAIFDFETFNTLKKNRIKKNHVCKVKQ